MNAPQKQYRFPLLVGSILILLTGLPYLYGYLRAPSDYVFTGINAITPGDSPVYYSWIEQARDGHFLFRKLYTGEIQPRILIHPVWRAIGMFARIFNLSAPLAFHLIRLLLIIPFTFFLWKFIGEFIREPIGHLTLTSLRRIALVFVAFAGGIGGLAAPAILIVFAQKSNPDLWPMDLWTPEAFTFLAIYKSPHFIISLWLMLLTYFGLVKTFTTKCSRRWMLLSMLTAGALFFIHPYYLPSIILIALVYCLVCTITERRFHQSFLSFATITLSALPATIYWGLLKALDPVTRSHSAQNITLMPPP